MVGIGGGKKMMLGKKERRCEDEGEANEERRSLETGLREKKVIHRCGQLQLSAAAVKPIFC